MHEEKFLSGWLRKDVEEERADMNGKKAEEEESKCGKSEVEREVEKTVIKRRCVNPFSGDVFEESSSMDE